ncbi:MAG TPA: hypothetical protein VEL76_23150 [Gemmataceae bacterium]|nr:hypothetical protein [Gemmataceae bacterium]
MAQILLAGEEPPERSALVGNVVVDRPAQQSGGILARILVSVHFFEPSNGSKK